MTEIKSGSLTEIMNNIYSALIGDEELLRLLTYPPEGYDSKNNYHYDPLDYDMLPSLVDTENDDYWDLVDDKIKVGEKTSDLEGKALCRIYIYEGRRRPVFGNFLVASQEVNINIFIHEDYEKDRRIAAISDRLNELLVLTRKAGLGEIEYVSGNPRSAPTHYRAYYHAFKVNTLKKVGSKRERF